MKRDLKICLACSIGGHLTQMLKLEKLYKKHNYFFVTERNEITENLRKENNMYFLDHYERRTISMFFILLKNLIYSFFYFIKEFPDIVISTGAGTAVPICYIAKLFGKKVIFIESFAKVNTPNMSGKLIYPIADLFIVQWEGMLKYYPKAVYGGSIY